MTPKTSPGPRRLTTTLSPCRWRTFQRPLLPTVTVTKTITTPASRDRGISRSGLCGDLYAGGATTWAAPPLPSWGDPDLRLARGRGPRRRKPCPHCPVTKAIWALAQSRAWLRWRALPPCAIMHIRCSAWRERADKDAVVVNFLMGTAHRQADGAFYSCQSAPAQEAVGATPRRRCTRERGGESAESVAPKADLGDGANGWTF